MRGIGWLGMGCAVCLLALAGCHRTRVKSPGATPVGPEHDGRQWFTIGGLVPLSGEDGEECAQTGVAETESYTGAVDILIGLGLGIAGALVAVEACENERSDPDDYYTCVSLVAGIPPLLLSSRTVEYRCAAPPQPQWAPPPPSYPRMAPPLAPPPPPPPVPPAAPPPPAPPPAAQPAAPASSSSFPPAA